MEKFCRFFKEDKDLRTGRSILQVVINMPNRATFESVRRVNLRQTDELRCRFNLGKSCGRCSR